MRFMAYCKNVSLNLVKALGVVTVTVVPILGLLIVYPNLMLDLDCIIAQHKLLFIIFRWGMLSIMYYSWPFFVLKLGQRRYWPSEQIEYWIKKRSKIMLWLILFELIVNEKLITVLWHCWKS